MGGYYSKLDDNGKLLELTYISFNYFQPVNRYTPNRSENDDQKKFKNKYLEYLNTYGFFKIKIEKDKILKHFQKIINSLETFQNTKNIEHFITKGRDVNDSIEGLLLACFLGFIIINSDPITEGYTKRFTEDNKIEFLLPKVYIVKDKYEEFIDFIMDDHVFTIDDIKRDEERTIQFLQIKNLLINLFKKINLSENPQVKLSNVLGLLLKLGGIFSLIYANDRKRSVEEKKRNYIKIIQAIGEEMIDVVPDDRCNMLDPENDFYTIDPELCKFDTKSIYQNKYEKCSDQLKILQSELSDTEGALSLWKIIAFAFILLFVIFLVLFIMKKCTLPVDDEDEYE